MKNRYLFCSKEGIADCMAWAGCSKEDIEKICSDLETCYYDLLEKKYISVEEFDRRMKEDENNR